MLLSLNMLVVYMYVFTSFSKLLSWKRCKKILELCNMTFIFYMFSKHLTSIKKKRETLKTKRAAKQQHWIYCFHQTNFRRFHSNVREKYEK